MLPIKELEQLKWNRSVDSLAFNVTDLKKEDILYDFPKAKELMLRAIDTYLASDSKDKNDRYGFWHGQSGINRANQLKLCLKAIPGNNKPALLVMLLAIFGKPSGFFDISLGRSSALASTIADLFITGDYRSGTDINIDTIESKVFSVFEIENIKNNHDSYRIVAMEYAGFSYLDQTKAVRILLQKILNSPEFKDYKTEIESLAEKIKSQLTNSTAQINLKVFQDLLDHFKEYKDSVTEAAFKGTQLPEGVPANISTFLDNKAAATVARVNKATRAAAIKNAPIKSRR